MQNSHYNAQSQQVKIMKIIEHLTQLLIRMNKRETLYKLIEDKIKTLDTANQDFYRALHDMRETIWMCFLMLLPVATVFVDYLLVFSNLNLVVPGATQGQKLGVAAVVVSCEIAISYLIMHLELEDRKTLLTRILPYTVLVFLFSFTGVAIWYVAQGYHPEIDGRSFWNYMFPTIIHQLSLFTGSALLHICIIKLAGHIHECFSFALYRIKRYILLAKRPKGGRGMLSSDGSEFVATSPKLVHLVHSFHCSYPNNNEHFTGAMPEDLRKAVNQVMGYDALKRYSVSNSSSYIPRHDEKWKK